MLVVGNALALTWDKEWLTILRIFDTYTSVPS